MTILEFQASELLAYWENRCVGDQVITKWADERIAELDAVDLPNWLMELSMKGPAKYLKEVDSGDPRPLNLGFGDLFAPMVETTDPDDHLSLLRFTRWIMCACMGEDLDDPRVALGYQIDHEWCDNRNESGAMAMAREAIAKLRCDRAPIAQILEH